MSDAFETLIKRKRDDTDDEYAPKAAATKKSKPKAPASVGTCSLNKKDFGDRIKAALRLEKYEAQRMRINVTMDVAFFRSFFGGHASITPADFSQDSPVVVAELNNSQAGEVFGVSKVKNGNRMTTLHLQSMMVVFYPSKGKASVWLTV
ncbi:Reverse transcriptase, RNaseH [Mycena sanguinolenta]|uniref:Reverse transcriptase, RNaseH n=1 Tax=Mycena sanguinolenta TaxID=230812 RepID=A0A8H6XNM5_9AGAR|nr:Reverse transcriptase, RNaseH [Mycena sanguinolenta]